MRTNLKKLCIYLQENDVRTMVEVGSFAGESTRMFATYIDEVISVDPYIGNYDSNDGSSNPENLAKAKEKFKQTTSGIKNIRQINRLSKEAVLLFENYSLDFVYIDACHKYECVKNDIELWWPKVRNWKFIGGDDFTCIAHPGVAKAVLEKFKPDLIFPCSSWIKKIGLMNE